LLKLSIQWLVKHPILTKKPFINYIIILINFLSILFIIGYELLAINCLPCIEIILLILVIYSSAFLCLFLVNGFLFMSSFSVFCMDDCYYAMFFFTSFLIDSMFLVFCSCFYILRSSLIACSSIKCLFINSLLLVYLGQSVSIFFAGVTINSVIYIRIFIHCLTLVFSSCFINCLLTSILLPLTLLRDRFCYWFIKCLFMILFLWSCSLLIRLLVICCCFLCYFLLFSFSCFLYQDLLFYFLFMFSLSLNCILTSYFPLNISVNHIIIGFNKFGNVVFDNDLLMLTVLLFLVVSFNTKLLTSLLISLLLFPSTISLLIILLYFGFSFCFLYIYTREVNVYFR